MIHNHIAERNLTIYDKIMFAIILIAAAAMWAYPILVTFGMNSPVTAVVQYGSNVVKEIDLSTNISSGRFKFGNSYGEYEVKDGAIRLLPMDKDICPKGICSKTGFIRSMGETIVCMPNQLIVKIIASDSSEAEFDSISY